MRITSKGQVTTPAEIRERAGRDHPLRRVARAEEAKKNAEDLEFHRPVMQSCRCGRDPRQNAKYLYHTTLFP